MSNNLWEIYNNLITLTKHRQWKSIEEQYSEKDFNSDMRLKGYVYIYGIDKIDINNIIVLTNESSNIPNHKDELVKILNNIDTSSHIILVSHKEMTTVNRAYARNNGWSIESHTYVRFKVDMTKVRGVPPHFILDQKDSIAVLESNYKEKIDMPKILRTDTQVIWLGAKPDDIIKIIRLSESTGESVIYKIVT